MQAIFFPIAAMKDGCHLTTVFDTVAALAVGGESGKIKIGWMDWLGAVRCAPKNETTAGKPSVFARSMQSRQEDSLRLPSPPLRGGDLPRRPGERGRQK